MSFDPDDWPELPPEVVELLVAPVVAPALVAPGTPDEPGPVPQSPPVSLAGQQQPVPVRRGYGECMPRFLAPAALSRTARRS
jgi:hypothetical protein